MKILHVMKREKFTAPVVGLYNKYFSNGEHEILYLNECGKNSLIYSEFGIGQREVFLPGNLFADMKILKVAFHEKQYDWIVLHSLLMPNSVKAFLYTDRRILKKVVWIEWGADLYTWCSQKKTVKGLLRNHVEYALRTKLHTTVCIFPPDCEVYREYFPKSKAEVFYAPYCGIGNALTYDQYKYTSRLDREFVPDDPVLIQVGHSATPAIDHKATLKQLSRFANQNIKILLPLSYGNDDYADSVQAYAEELFADKVICLRQMMPLEEYKALIDKVDIAIFDTYRQIALGNIRPMIFHNTKVFLPENSVMYKYFKSGGVPLSKTEDLNDISFNEFIKSALPEDNDKFQTFLKNNFSEVNSVGFWLTIYDKLRKETM